MTNKSRLIIFILIGISFSLLILLFTLAGLIIYYVSRTPETPEKYTKMRTNTYRIQQLDTLSKTTNVGIVRIPQDLETDDFISYRQDISKPTLISNFGSKGYRCSGTCSCEDESRRYSGALTRSAGALFVAMTASAAYLLAETEFDETCKESFADDCPEESITSSVEDCQEESADTESSFNDKEYDKYLCGGYCVDGEEIYDLPVISISNIKPGFPDCEKMDVSMNVKVEKGLGEEAAIKVFVDEHMKPFCMETSQVVVEAGTHCCRATHKVPFCTGGTIAKSSFEYNPSLVCQKTL